MPLLSRSCRRTAASAVIAAAVLCSPPARASAQEVSASALKAAFLVNFARFSDWHSLDASAPLVLCVLGDTTIARALSDAVRGQSVDSHPLTVVGLTGDVPVSTCQVLFISSTATRQAAATLDGLKSHPVLTVSDGKGFAQSTGIVELFVDADGRMRFAINTDAVSRAGLHLSSRVLGLAQIVRDRHVQ